MSSIYDFTMKSITGQDVSFETYRGKVLLIVNVASKCGLTSQYEGLEALQRKYHDRGFEVLGFPCNQFGGQEPGAEKEIKQFCSANFGVTFPLFAKVEVKGPGAHPLFAALTGKEQGHRGTVYWNFNKFLIDENGIILKKFESSVKPMSEEIVSLLK